ncbi:MAG TPA: SH3 domain-containing protein [Verrucomicrobiae bacterium]|nr:SH3 domain-containing protein [Verrucomicrobiae bacterium]
MKRFTSLCVLSAALLTADAVRADSLAAPTPSPLSAGSHGTVLKDKVNVRARGNKTAEIVAQLNKGDSVDIVEHKGEWLRIVLPAGANCYVSTKFVKGGVATSDNVNIRCGPSTNYKEVGKLAKGEAVEVVKLQGDWVAIKPTAHCTGWVAAELVEIAAAAPPTPAPITTSEVVTPPVSLPAAPMQPAEQDEVHVRYVVRDGIFQAVKDTANAPAPYELLTEEVDTRQYRTAYLETTDKNLARYEGKHVRVRGNETWRRSQRYPVIAVERIDMVW